MTNKTCSVRKCKESAITSLFYPVLDPNMFWCKLSRGVYLCATHKADLLRVAKRVVRALS